MKKLIPLLFILLGLVSCTSDDDNANINFDSTLAIDDVAFLSGNSTPAAYVYDNGSPDQVYRKMTFAIEKKAGNSNDVITFSIYNPGTQSGFSGTYSLGIVEMGDRYANGTYVGGGKYYAITGASITVTDLGNARYRIQFNDCMALDTNTSLVRQLTGSFEGVFVVGG